MTPPALSLQITQSIEETRTQAALSFCFSLMNQRQQTEAKAREDAKIAKTRLWWKEQEND